MARREGLRLGQRLARDDGDLHHGAPARPVEREVRDRVGRAPVEPLGDLGAPLLLVRAGRLHVAVEDLARRDEELRRHPVGRQSHREVAQGADRRVEVGRVEGRLADRRPAALCAVQEPDWTCRDVEARNWVSLLGPSTGWGEGGRARPGASLIIAGTCQKGRFVPPRATHAPFRGLPRMQRTQPCRYGGAQGARRPVSVPRRGRRVGGVRASLASGAPGSPCDDGRGSGRDLNPGAICVTLKLRAGQRQAAAPLPGGPRCARSRLCARPGLACMSPPRHRRHRGRRHWRRRRKR